MGRGNLIIPEGPRLLERTELDDHLRLLEFASNLSSRSESEEESVVLSEAGIITPEDAVGFAFRNADNCENVDEARDLLAFVSKFSGFSLPEEIKITDDRLEYPAVPIHPYNDTGANTLGDSIKDSIMVCIMTGDQELTLRQQASVLARYDKVRGLGYGRYLNRKINERLLAADIGIVIAATVKGFQEKELHPYKKYYRERRDPLIIAYHKNREFAKRHIKTSAYRLNLLKTTYETLRYRRSDNI